MKKISRRSFVKAAGVAAVLGALTACGGSSSSTAASSTASSAAGSAAASSGAASAAFGTDTQAIVDRGVLKVGVKNAVQGFSSGNLHHPRRAHEDLGFLHPVLHRLRLGAGRGFHRDQGAGRPEG